VKPAVLKFTTDENISPRLVAFLRGRGHDVKDVKEEGWQGLNDAELLRKAWRDGRFIISHDRDFGRPAIGRHRPCYGVIYLRLKDQRAASAINVMERFLDRRINIKPGTLVVLQEARARLRPLPGR
jgi:predicted nuclease of predicted toxin-antitoxin system